MRAKIKIFDESRDYIIEICCGLSTDFRLRTSDEN